MKQKKLVKNYVAFALCILTSLSVEQVFDVLAYKPEIITSDFTNL